VWFVDIALWCRLMDQLSTIPTRLLAAYAQRYPVRRSAVALGAYDLCTATFRPYYSYYL
jgi:hypothetical protein